MKKRKVIIIISCVIILAIVTTIAVLFATGKISFNSNNSGKAEENNVKTPDDNNQLEENTNNKKYALIFEEYKEALNDENFENMIDVDDTYPHINEWIVKEKIRTDKENSEYNFNISYTYYDIDKNGLDELVMFAVYDIDSSKPTIIDIYTYDSNENKPVKVIDDGSLGYRAHADIYNNGIILLQGSSGADNGVVEITKILSDGHNVENKIYYYKYEDVNTLTFYESYENMNNKKDKLSYKSFEELENEYIKNASIVKFNDLKTILDVKETSANGEN